MLRLVDVKDGRQTSCSDLMDLYEKGHIIYIFEVDLLTRGSSKHNLDDMTAALICDTLSDSYLKSHSVIVAIYKEEENEEK